jgi:hypothetical protein
MLCAPCLQVGEKVLVPHTDKFYEAKIQKAQRREDGLWYYFLHYLGVSNMTCIQLSVFQLQLHCLIVCS